MSHERVLLSEGSSLSSRQAITALGSLGYRLELCDSDPLCLGRFSRFVCRFHRCPAMGEDALGYLKSVLRLLRDCSFDVLLPTHEQAYLFSKAKPLLAGRVGVALPDFEVFQQVQDKSLFFRLLSRLSIPHPETCFVHTVDALRSINEFPCYIKSSFGTATSGVWRVTSRTYLRTTIAAVESRGLLDEANAVIVQKETAGAA